MHGLYIYSFDPDQKSCVLVGSSKNYAYLILHLRDWMTQIVCTHLIG
jgi:hypothetical protein